ncbi:DUF4142 domain-containing protein [Hansschlegelia plantiphila]|uniref:DUF4142 domain-containing protein n=1 Tax=Hansschlegelia plantiphila TaxID=374655 RepID=A0A9W6J586_9HYPH|nr:DUF4142 domain-containing protein [Hansschlegelia plantiphila]GLK69644.1 hypothetical protein GCM10008179_32820 [Hansschlegelia plantiphila]
MKKTTTFLALCMLAAAPASAQSIGEKTGANSVLGITPSTEDFVMQAAQSDKFEIRSSELAAAKGDEATKTFAAQMIDAHKKTTEELTALVGSDAPKVSLPTDMSSGQVSMLDDLKGRSGGDLSDQYVDDQVSAHKDAVSLFQRYADGGDNPKLKAWAAQTLPALQHHLEMAQQLDK